MQRNVKHPMAWIPDLVERAQQYTVLLIIFPTCSFAGLAALLRSGKELTARAIASAMLNSGFFGVITCAFLMHRNQGDFSWFTLAISLLAGVGGNTTYEAILESAVSFLKFRANGK